MKFFNVEVRDLSGKFLGRIADKEGNLTTKKIRASLYTEDQATRLVKQINDGGFETAKAVIIK